MPESLAILDDLDKYESRSMHGQMPIVWDHAEDFQVGDRYGNTWIDFSSTIFVANAGHANPKICEALKRIIDQKLLHSYTYYTEIRRDYIRKLIEFTPSQFEKAFLLSSGTEATECALKLMRMQGNAIGKKKPGIISFEGSMHGRTLGSQMMGGTPAAREWIGYEDPNIHRLPFPYPWTLKDDHGHPVSGEALFTRHIEHLQKTGVNPDTDICGFILESYIGWGAVFFPVDYVKALVAFARKHDILVTFDEIQAGFGRTGTLFAYQNYGVEPDIICCGKGISSSLPLSAVLGSRKIMDLPDIGSMSSTHSANPLCCAAGLANIEFIESHNLVADAKRKGKILLDGLKGIQKKYPDRISEVLGKGLVAAILIVDPKTRLPDSLTASLICEKAMQKGLILVHTGRESIKMGPPLTIPDEALLEGLHVLEESIKEIVKP
ncbi:aminotransferase class III-fold pyridoxal phosphate-dependent enzyme [uncultured Methanoregula sp.]|uniref:aspartate aminotransferase family protein n=1 Tax=uncultured Methanoregula sp. TaxID=1005933 RepID=UPI002AABA836|nr:aminotransferase class III-fold pyridoxal phosphate-dependent enzyme [uncultured Methanoregula sp.]